MKSYELKDYAKSLNWSLNIWWRFIMMIKLQSVLHIIQFNMILLNKLRQIDTPSKKKVIMDIFPHLLW